MTRNKERRYRLSDSVAQKLGLALKPSRRYYITKEQEDKFIAMQPASIKRLFFDIETSPNIVYSWRIGYNLNIDHNSIIDERKIICISYKWENEDKVNTLTWDKDQNDKQMLIDFMKIINSADEVIGHNSDRFDLKWLRTRCIFHRVPMFPSYRTLDTLKKARSGFNFNSNKLDYIARFLGVGAKLKHEGFSMWKKVLNGDSEALKRMVEYCEKDVIVLEDVYRTLQSYITPNTHSGVINGNAKFSCPTCSSEDVQLLKNTVTPKGTISRVMECDCCNYVYTISNASYINFLKFKSEQNHDS